LGLKYLFNFKRFVMDASLKSLELKKKIGNGPEH